MLTLLVLVAFSGVGLSTRSPTPIITSTQPPPPLYTIPCTMGNNAPCPTSWFCTPTEYCPTPTATPCHGVCFYVSPLPPVIPCTVGNDAPCPTGSTCTPTMVSTPSVPWGGQCISTPAGTTPPPVSSTSTICTVGNNAPCSTGSVCTPTMACTSGTPCGGACIATPPPVTLTPCVIGNNAPCGTGSTCTPTMACTGTSTPCGGACIATPPPPVSTICTVGNNAGCSVGSTCTPTETVLVTDDDPEPLPDILNPATHLMRWNTNNPKVLDHLLLRLYSRPSDTSFRPQMSYTHSSPAMDAWSSKAGEKVSTGNDAPMYIHQPTASGYHSDMENQTHRFTKDKYTYSPHCPIYLDAGRHGGSNPCNPRPREPLNQLLYLMCSV
ncbi:hypothetical protein B0H63DRAFT_557140 [Podospora didyma]|uniref:Uncharacterized protein n=1 Tax=Podospora didyma TaxID=330526 RepID=A0AAE0NYL9_9PEZI|nr:hypothetical protein B0H63DRAFT_557140 [Podospora didyma]